MTEKTKRKRRKSSPPSSQPPAASDKAIPRSPLAGLVKLVGQSQADFEAEKAAREELALLERQAKLEEGLPFLHGWRWYAWAREFFESDNKLNFVCAANQIGKSSAQIRKCIDWATNQEKWPRLWQKKPVQFWYLYPTQKQVSIEFETKWKQFLPRGEFKDDPIYGWRDEWKNHELFAIHFNSGVHVYFKTYAQNAQSLQTGTCDALFCDEELPVDLYDELIFRISASDGYFHMVFTATLGQEYWRLVMEPRATEEEALPGAFKRVVSMYDCQYFDDGTASHWTDDRIEVVKSRCKSHAEVLRRVFGHFIRDDGGLKYAQFDYSRHMVKPHAIPSDWWIYAGIDIGSGGKENHPAAIVFVAASPEYQEGRIFLGWRGDGIQTATSDIYAKFVDLRDTHKLSMTRQFYDWGSKDFGIMVDRLGESFEPANKSHELGEQVINVLFKNDLLKIFDTPELRKLAAELASLRKETPKNKAKDDLTDALRYALTSIPWDWSVIKGAPVEQATAPVVANQETPFAREIRERRERFMDGPDDSTDWGVEAELEDAQEMLEG